MRVRQSGTTLVGLMVGTAIGLLTILAMLVLFKSVTLHAAQSSTAAMTNGAVASGLLSAQLRVQSAGYGIGSQLSATALVNTDLILLRQATLSGSTISGSVVSITTRTTSDSSGWGNALIWDVGNDSGTVDCYALLAADSIIRLLSASNCASASDWANLSWTSTTLLNPYSYTDSATSDQPFFATLASCFPFGKGDDVDAVEVIMRADNASPMPASSYTVCLPNILAE